MMHAWENGEVYSEPAKPEPPKVKSKGIAARFQEKMEEQEVSSEYTN